MSFSMPSYPIATPQQASPYAGLVQNAMDAYSDAIKNKMLPQTLQADIFSKQFAPLAQIASSPLALAMLPDQRQQMAQLISQLVQRSMGQTGSTGMVGAVNPGITGGSVGGNMGAPSPQGNMQGGGTAGGSVGGNMGAPSPQGNMQGGGTGGSIGGGGSGTITNPAASTGNPNLPSGNFGSAVTAHAMAPSQEQLHPPGTLYNTPSGESVTSTPATISDAQDRINSIKGFISLSDDLINQSKEFAGTGYLEKLRGSQASNVLDKIGLSGIAQKISDDPGMAGRYTTYNNNVIRAGHLLKTIFPTSNDAQMFQQYADALQVHLTDTPKQYEQRIKGVVNDLQNKFLPVYNQAMGSQGGYDVSKNNIISDQLENSPQARKEGIAQFSVGNQSGQGVVQATKNIRGESYVKINGRWFHQ